MSMRVETRVFDEKTKKMVFAVFEPCGVSDRWSESMARAARGGNFSQDLSAGGRTRQEFKDECDVNLIMARFQKTGQWPPRDAAAPVYLDVSGAPDLMTALQVMSDADQAFMSLPARVRAEFENDPLKFVAFAADENNLDQLRDWGLAKPKEAAPQPQAVRIVQDDSEGSGRRRKASDAPSDA